MNLRIILNYGDVSMLRVSFRPNYLAVKKIRCNFAPAFCGIVPIFAM
jgi:hypothetical protein